MSVGLLFILCVVGVIVLFGLYPFVLWKMGYIENPDEWLLFPLLTGCIIFLIGVTGYGIFCGISYAVLHWSEIL